VAATAVAAEVVEPAPADTPAAEPAVNAPAPAVAEAVEATTDTGTAIVATAQADTSVEGEGEGEVEVEADAANTPAPSDKSTLHVSRPTQNELTLTINGESITLHPEQLGQLIEELAHARASMQPEPPPGIPAGWRFVTTKNPMMAVQKQSNGDRLLVARHTGYGWVPFTFSPDVVVQMYMMLTQR